MAKIKTLETVVNSIGKESVQSVFIEDEIDGETWSIINHCNEEISLSLVNLRILQNQINTAIKLYDNHE